MTEHKFKIGQSVRVQVQSGNASSSERYEIVKLLPASMDSRRDFQYRIRQRDLNVERVVSESQLWAFSGNAGNAGTLITTPFSGSAHLIKKGRRSL
jgi:hypothetical protein